MVNAKQHHKVVIIGGGAAGVDVGARLGRSGVSDVAIIEPSDTHWYQPLWTLVGGGCVTLDKTRRPQADIMPKRAHWIKDAADAVNPDEQEVSLASGGVVGYDWLVVCPGIQLNWDLVGGLTDALGHDGVSSNYLSSTAPTSWEFIRSMKRGTAVFTMPAGPIKCAGAPQKIAYLAADYWRKHGVLKDINVVLALPTPAMFGVPEFSTVLVEVARRYGIDVKLQHELSDVDGTAKEVVLLDRSGGDAKQEVVPYDFLHAVPPQSAPDWLRQSPLADQASPFGYVEVDKNTHEHVRYPNVFALGDAGSTPNSKTAAAIRKQAPVVVANLRAAMKSKELPARYDGYSSCPLTTSRHRMLLAEFDYTMKPHPTFPLINTQKERYDMWLLKRYGLSFMYWHFMTKGLV
ncbi:MAG TPA: FAD/NAD(P)-binding oxidoreductase [Acidimicrobiales bacterium]|nr:FAD/NAD(P)-binding oxidoreductase [Acidimicrobiales bacterium]